MREPSRGSDSSSHNSTTHYTAHNTRDTGRSYRQQRPVSWPSREAHVPVRIRKGTQGHHQGPRSQLHHILPAPTRQGVQSGQGRRNRGPAPCRPLHHPLGSPDGYLQTGSGSQGHALRHLAQHQVQAVPHDASLEGVGQQRPAHHHLRQRAHSLGGHGWGAHLHSTPDARAQASCAAHTTGSGGAQARDHGPGAAAPGPRWCIGGHRGAVASRVVTGYAKVQHVAHQVVQCRGAQRNAEGSQSTQQLGHTPGVGGVALSQQDVQSDRVRTGVSGQGNSGASCSRQARRQP
jgi:hypothetical protein